MVSICTSLSIGFRLDHIVPFAVEFLGIKIDALHFLAKLFVSVEVDTAGDWISCEGALETGRSGNIDSDRIGRGSVRCDGGLAA